MGLLLPFHFAFAQSKNERLQADQLHKEANRLFDQMQDSLALLTYGQARSIYLKNGIIGPNLVENCLNRGILYQIKEEFPKAIEAYKESIGYRKKIHPVLDSSYFISFVLVASTYTKINKFDSAYSYYQQAEQLLKWQPEIEYVVRFYNEMGYLSRLLGNYTLSINYYEKALKVLNYDPATSKNPAEYVLDRYVIYSSNIANALQKLGHYRESIDQSLKLAKYLIVPEKVYLNLAGAYLQLQQPDSAMLYLAKIAIHSLPSSTQIDYYTSLGHAYTQKKEYQQALSGFDRAKQMSLDNFGAKNNRLADAYTGKGQVYEAQGNYREGLQQYQLAIQSLHFAFHSPDIYQNPAELTNVASPLQLFGALRHKAHAFRQYFNQTHLQADLDASLRTYQLAFQLADRIRKGYDSDEAKLFFANTVSPVYEEAIEAAYQLYSKTRQTRYLETAFALAEQSKAAVLAESLRELEIRQIPNISKGLIEKEKDLKRNIAALNSLLVEATDSAKRVQYQDQIRDYEIELARTLKEFEKNQQYYQLKYDTDPIRVSQLQGGLDDQTAFLEYMVGKNHLYLFTLTKDSFKLLQLGSTASFKRDWNTLYAALYQSKPNTRYQGTQAAYGLYRQLFSPAAASLQGKRHLVIIPDKELGYLPFEALNTDPSGNHYLLEDFTIGYGYSGKLLRNPDEAHTRSREVSVLAMAPFAINQRSDKMPMRADLGEPPLYASADEVTQIGGKVYTAQAATKELFLRQANQYDIVHLATHAKANNDDPLHSFVAFHRQPAAPPSQYRLYAQELYNLRLHKPQLVVLSACETGSGKLVQGEGIMSLARAFAYAGCPSIVTTLWKAEDQTTAYIATHLHEYLKAGKPKDEALRQAKLDYLASQTHSRFKSPVYWANFIFIGDAAPVYSHASYWWWILGGGVLSIVALAVYRKKRLIKQNVMKQA